MASSRTRALCDGSAWLPVHSSRLTARGAWSLGPKPAGSGAVEVHVPLPLPWCVARVWVYGRANGAAPMVSMSGVGGQGSLVELGVQCQKADVARSNPRRAGIGSGSVRQTVIEEVSYQLMGYFTLYVDGKTKSWCWSYCNRTYACTQFTDLSFPTG